MLLIIFLLMNRLHHRHTSGVLRVTCVVCTASLLCVAMVAAELQQAASMALRSSAWKDGDRIPDQFTVEGADVSPPLEWSDLPEGSKSLAIICADPDVKRKGGWVHWAIWNIPADSKGLPEGIKRDRELSEPITARQGQTSWGKKRCGYFGPATPEGVGNHTYVFTLYSLDADLDLKAGASAPELEKAMEGHVLAKATLAGTFSRGATPPPAMTPAP